jgi:hypothetical protein
MKKQLTIAFLSLAAVSSWAQGTVDFRNGGSIVFADAATHNRYVYAAGPIGPGDTTDAARRLTGTNYCAGLWYVAGGGNGGQLAGGRGGAQALSGTNINVALGNVFNFRAATTADVNKGVWLPPIGADTLLVLAGVAPGESATLQVRVWDAARFGRNEAGYLAALTAGSGVGFSAPFDYTVPTGLFTPDKLFMTGLSAFVMVPEPSTIALGVLGAASLLFLRRRK